MKQNKIVCLITLLLLLSCTNSIHDIEITDSNQNIATKVINYTEQTHPLIEGRFVDFVNNQYVITITKEEALAEGISEKEYDDFFKTITEGNFILTEIIDSCVNAGRDVIVESCIYEDNTVNSAIPILKTAGETVVFPYGTISTIGQEYGYASVEVLPIEMRSVDCSCYSNVAIVPMQVVVASSLGVDNVKSGFGQYIKLNVPFSATNVPGGIKYKTTDSNGGKCTWVGSSYHPNIPINNVTE